MVIQQCRSAIYSLAGSSITGGTLRLPWARRRLCLDGLSQCAVTLALYRAYTLSSGTIHNGLEFPGPSPPLLKEDPVAAVAPDQAPDSYRPAPEAVYGSLRARRRAESKQTKLKSNSYDVGTILEKRNDTALQAQKTQPVKINERPGEVSLGNYVLNSRPSPVVSTAASIDPGTQVTRPSRNDATDPVQRLRARPSSGSKTTAAVSKRRKILPPRRGAPAIRPMLSSVSVVRPIVPWPSSNMFSRASDRAHGIQQSRKPWRPWNEKVPETTKLGEYVKHRTRAEGLEEAEQKRPKVIKLEDYINHLSLATKRQGDDNKEPASPLETFHKVSTKLLTAETAYEAPVQLAATIRTSAGTDTSAPPPPMSLAEPEPEPISSTSTETPPKTSPLASGQPDTRPESKIRIRSRQCPPPRIIYDSAEKRRPYGRYLLKDGESEDTKPRIFRYATWDTKALRERHYGALPRE